MSIPHQCVRSGGKACNHYGACDELSEQDLDHIERALSYAEVGDVLGDGVDVARLLAEVRRHRADDWLTAYREAADREAADREAALAVRLANVQRTIEGAKKNAESIARMAQSDKRRAHYESVASGLNTALIAFEEARVSDLTSSVAKCSATPRASFHQDIRVGTST